MVLKEKSIKESAWEIKAGYGMTKNQNYGINASITCYHQLANDKRMPIEMVWTC